MRVRIHRGASQIGGSAIEIEAAARSRFKEWEEQLDAVLDAYFDEDAE